MQNHQNVLRSRRPRYQPHFEWENEPVQVPVQANRSHPSLSVSKSFSFASSPKNSYLQDDINHLLRLHLENDSTLNALEELTFRRLIPIHRRDVLISRHATGDVFRVSPRFTFECEPVEAERLRVFG